MKYRYGTLAFCEWDGLWKNKPQDPDVTEDEYEDVVHKLDGYFRTTFTESPQYIKDFYVRGDYTGDRTQVVEINNPRILTLDFLKVLQRWLQQPAFSNWRIIVPTYITDEEVIVVYPEKIRISPQYEHSLEEAIKSITGRMKDYT